MCRGETPQGSGGGRSARLSDCCSALRSRRITLRLSAVPAKRRGWHHALVPRCPFLAAKPHALEGSGIPAGVARSCGRGACAHSHGGALCGPSFSGHAFNKVAARRRLSRQPPRSPAARGGGSLPRPLLGGCKHRRGPRRIRRPPLPFALATTAPAGVAGAVVPGSGRESGGATQWPHTRATGVAKRTERERQPPPRETGRRSLRVARAVAPGGRRSTRPPVGLCSPAHHRLRVPYARLSPVARLRGTASCRSDRGRPAREGPIAATDRRSDVPVGWRRETEQEGAGRSAAPPGHQVSGHG